MTRKRETAERRSLFFPLERASRGRDGEDLADLDLVGVVDDGAVGLIEFRPAGAGAVELLGDAPQAVAGGDGVSVLRGRLPRRFLRRRLFRGFGGRFLSGKIVILGEVYLQGIQLGLGQTGAADIASGCGGQIHLGKIGAFLGAGDGGQDGDDVAVFHCLILFAACFQMIIGRHDARYKENLCGLLTFKYSPYSPLHISMSVPSHTRP